MKLLDNKLFLNMIIALAVASLLSISFSLGFFYTWQTSLGDALYKEKTPLNDIVIISIDDKSLEEIGRWPWDRTRFAEILEKLDNAKVVGIDIGFYEQSNEISDKSLAEAIEKSGNVVLPVEYTEFIVVDNSIFAEEILKPIPILLNSTENFGYVNVLEDSDGVTRSLLLEINSDEIYRSFSEEIYMNYIGRDFNYEDEKLLINFVGKSGTFKAYSFADVLNGKINGDEFGQKIVLIGATSDDLKDNFIVPTSYGGKMPGVELHANTLQTMLTRNFIVNQPSSQVIVLIFLLSIILSLILSYFRIFTSTMIIIGILILYIASGFLFFDRGIIINLVYPTLTIFVTYGAVVLAYYITEEKHKKWVVNAFGKYISKDLLKEIIDKKQDLKLGGEKRAITIFFSDIRGFTTISEAMSPEELVSLLNEYLTEMTKIILDHKGTLDKFIGDAIMAFWNAPLTIKDHAKLCCEAAAVQIKSLKSLQKKWKSEGKPLVNIGCGIHTGEAIIGNMGSEERFDYTAMGDSVNLASRLEGLTKNYGVSIIVSESTYKLVKNDFSFRKLDAVKVKGKKLPVIIYELMVEEDKEFCKKYEEAFELYFSSKFKQAIKIFQEAQKIKKDDISCELFIERCKEYMKNPPGKNWDGAFVMKTK